MINLKVIGYYGHYNAGDEQYKITFKQLFDNYLSNYNIEFIDCDTIISYTFHSTDVIIVGGGDVLNDYFLDKIIAKFNGCNNKIIAVSVGLPFKSTLTKTSKLNIIDYIFVRNKCDMDLFATYFHIHRVYYLPDISFLLSTYITDSNNIYLNRLSLIKNMNKKIACIALTRHIYTHNSASYTYIVSSICHIIKTLLSKKYHILIVPFNCNPQNDKENDMLINQDLLSELLSSTRVTLSDVTFVSEWQEPIILFEMFKYTDLCISMRYHGCMFSFNNNVPCFPIFTTRKVKNLLLDYNWQYGYELEVDANGYPIKFDEQILYNRFNTFLYSVEKRNNLKQKLQDINAFSLPNQIDKSRKILVDALTIPYSKANIKSLTNNQTDKFKEKINSILYSIQKFVNDKGYSDFRDIKDDNLQDIIVSIVSYNLTNGDIHSNYYYGLKSKMFNVQYNYEEEWTWIMQQESSANKIKNGVMHNPFGLFNIGYINQNDSSGVHRFGWQYVYEHIKHLHNESCDLYLDLYLDKTFHWDKEINKILGVIPYKKKWMGFIHHTFETSFSDYNCYNLLSCNEFLESLKMCQGLFVLSRYLSEKLINELAYLDIHVPVYDLIHPTEIYVPKFSIDKFLENKNKQLIQIGGWLRNIYSFYKLTLPRNLKMHIGFLIGDKSKKALATHDVTLGKVVLKGKHMDNYYPLPSFLESLHQSLITNNSQNTVLPYISHNISQNVSTAPSCDLMEKRITNNWYKHMYSDVSTMVKSVNVITYLTNNEYDNLLTCNIVFVNLVDASAVNTVIECIVRYTPIIVNKHPAVVELLGDDYPLYFPHEPDNYTLINKHVNLLLKDSSNIKKAHYHLQELDITKFTIQAFINKLVALIRDNKI